MPKPVTASKATPAKSPAAGTNRGAIRKAMARGAVASSSTDLPAPEETSTQPRPAKSSKPGNSPPTERSHITTRLRSFRRQQAERRAMAASPTRLGATAAAPPPAPTEESAGVQPSISAEVAAGDLPEGFDSDASRDVIRTLERAGWQLQRIKGSHHHFKHPTRSGLVTVPHPKAHIPRRTLNYIVKQAGFNPEQK